MDRRGASVALVLELVIRETKLETSAIEELIQKLSPRTPKHGVEIDENRQHIDL